MGDVIRGDFGRHSFLSPEARDRKDEAELRQMSEHELLTAGIERRLAVFRAKGVDPLSDETLTAVYSFARLSEHLSLEQRQQVEQDSFAAFVREIRQPGTSEQE